MMAAQLDGRALSPEHLGHDLEGEAGMRSHRATAHLDAHLDRLEDLLLRRSGLGCLPDVPLHAGLAVDDDGDADSNQLLRLLRQVAVGESCPLHLQEGLVDLGIERQQLRVRLGSALRHLFELAHSVPPDCIWVAA